MQSTDCFLGAEPFPVPVPETQVVLGKSLWGPLVRKGVSHLPAVAKESLGLEEAPGASC